MPDIVVTKEVVVNRSYGAFSMSREAVRRYGELKGGLHFQETDRTYWLSSDAEGEEIVSSDDIARDDPALIATVRELGPKASGTGDNLQVATVEITLDIGGQGGFEGVRVSGYATYG